MLRDLRRRYSESTLARCIRVLEKRDRNRFLFISLVQVFLSIIDLVGVAIVGILGALAISGVESRKAGNRVNASLKLLHIDQLTLQSQATILGISAGIILIGRTLLSIYFTRRTLLFLSNRGARVSSGLISKMLAMPFLYIQKKTIQESVYALTVGVETITLRVLGNLASMIADSSLLIVMSVGLLAVDPSIALVTLALFLVVGLILYKLMNGRARELGITSTTLEVQSNEKIVEVLSSYRESIVRNRRTYYSSSIAQIRSDLSESLAGIAFLPFISKYILETTVVLGGLLIGGIQFFTQDAVHAVATLTIFMAAGSRVGPAVLRIQQGAIQVKGSLGAASPTLTLIEELNSVEIKLPEDSDLTFTHEGFTADVLISDTSVTYPMAKKEAIKNVNLRILEGEQVAIVGSSGAGKTTLVDIILGVLDPTTGEVQISKKKPLDAISLWPGAIAYVPQDILISNSTIKQNVGLGYSVDSKFEAEIWDALEVAHLGDFVRSLPNGLDTQVGERGASFSGGQRQRLGIARAMFTKPRLLVLDEATSALDGETEASISQAIQALKGKSTVILVAHRLSTVRNVDKVIYLDHGVVKAVGKFDEVRAKVPDFDNQAKLMGL